MRLALFTALLVLSVGVIAAPVDAKPSSYCEPTDDRIGVHCHAEVSPTCFWDTWITVEDGYEAGGHCH